MPPFAFNNHPRPQSLRALSQVRYTPYWLDDPARPDPAPSLTETTDTDLLIVGGGFTGLWAALLTKEENPARDVVLLEARRIADGASGRNGGFVAASLTHGFANGFQRWPREMPQLVALGHANLQGIEAAIQHYQIDCDYIRAGELNVATAPYQVQDLRAETEAANACGEDFQFLDQSQIQALVHSPTYLGARLDPWVGMVNPARLAWGLRRACLERGVRLFENTPVTKLEPQGARIHARTPYGQVRAGRVALATNAYPPLLKRLSYYIVPVYDYVLMTEPLSPAQREAIGWHGRQGIGDSGNQFHYYQITADGRILWGGYDAIYYPGNGVGPQYDQHPESFARLAEHFFQTFPQLEGLRFTHAWGGAIDTCSRFSVFWGTAHQGRTAYALGYTGLGVGASRFGAQVMLDLLDGRTTERTALSMVRGKPVPFPPEPARSWVVNFTRWSLDQADQNNGRRNLWLRALDALGLGFDS
ncbi:MAG: FAD-dependent oxidoreductase [Anaerolineales bacterium]